MNETLNIWQLKIWTITQYAQVLKVQSIIKNAKQKPKRYSICFKHLIDYALTNAYIEC